MKAIFPVLLVCLLLLAGCTAPGAVTSTPAASPTATLIPAPVEDATPTPVGPVTLRIWVPPQFDPDSGTPAGELLRRRLEEYHARRPDINIQVRLKAADGPGGLLDSLTTASTAAPLALPDLVALPRPLLETAALKGLLHPFDDLVSKSEDPDWFPYALQLARVQDSVFGLPFAGDALIIIHRSPQIEAMPGALAEIQTLSGPLAFPAADPQALFTLALYQAAGGLILDGEGRPYLDQDVLAQVLAFYQQAAASDLAPVWLTQIQTDQQAWDAFLESQAPLLITWASRYLSEMPAGSGVAPLPTLDGAPFTLANGWVWALASPNPQHQRMSAELAEYLTESDFLAAWTAEAGYLPPRPSSLEAWANSPGKVLAGQVAGAARLIPSTDVLASLALPLQQATMQVLKQQTDAATAARQAAEALSGP